MGRFLLGFAIGAVIGAVAVIVTAPRSGAATRQGIGELISGILEAARQASASRERELWAEFRARLEEKETSSQSSDI